MDEADRLQIGRLTSRAAERCLRDYSERFSRICADHAVKGRLQSGATIHAAIRLMEECAREAMVSLLADVGTVNRSAEAFEQIDEAMQAILRALAENLVRVSKVASGDKGNGTSAASRALESYHAMKSVVEADLLIARYGFVTGSGKTRETIPPPLKNTGGKPLAAHWDEMWAELAARFWNGELDPASQADIKREMFAWFAEKEIEVGDTAVTQRARQLWRKIEARR